MKIPVRIVFVFLCAALVALGATGVTGQQVVPQPKPATQPTKPQVVPARVGNEIIWEAGKFIKQSLDRPRLNDIPPITVRANALLVALVAQNRIGTVAGDEAQRLATLRDAAIRLAIVVELEKTLYNLAELRVLNDVIIRYPDITPNPDASLSPVGMKKIFNHDDIASVFGGCDGNKTQRLEFKLATFIRQKTAFAATDAEKIELMACKLTLLGEFLQEFDDLIHPATKRTPENQKEWVQFANKVQQTSWQLANTVRGDDAVEMKKVLKTLQMACSDCHCKYRE